MKTDLFCLSVALVTVLLPACKDNPPPDPTPPPSAAPTHAATHAATAAPPPTAAAVEGPVDPASMQPKHVPHDANDHPVVMSLRDLYQSDKEFSKLFAANGKSEICGPTALSNALLYLKHDHKPPFPKLFGHVKDSDTNAHNVVEEMFKLCKTDKDKGSNATRMKDCAQEVLDKGGYKVAVLQLIESDRRTGTPPTLEQVREAAKEKHATILTFAWFDKAKHTRTGGHWVALAGYDAKETNTIYVTNPLIKDYPKDHVYSKVVLSKVTKKDGDFNPNEQWETEHLFGGSKYIAVLESMLTVLPK
jgi:hypothetical protein